MSVFKMAWRNLWRNRRRSIVTISAMTLALCVEILYSGLVTGYLQGMEAGWTGSIDKLQTLLAKRGA